MDELKINGKRVGELDAVKITKKYLECGIKESEIARMLLIAGFQEDRVCAIMIDALGKLYLEQSKRRYGHPFITPVVKLLSKKKMKKRIIDSLLLCGITVGLWVIFLRFFLDPLSKTEILSTLTIESFLITIVIIFFILIAIMPILFGIKSILDVVIKEEK